MTKMKKNDDIENNYNEWLKRLTSWKYAYRPTKKVKS